MQYLLHHQAASLHLQNILCKQNYMFKQLKLDMSKSKILDILTIRIALVSEDQKRDKTIQAWWVAGL